jgi:hypothetical protein
VGSGRIRIKEILSDAEPVSKALEKGAVVDSVKGSRQIEETETGDVLAGGYTDEMVIHREKSSFSRVEFYVGWLEDIKKRVSREMDLDTLFDNSFGYFWEVRHVWYWSVVGEVVRVRIWFLAEWSDNGFFEIRWECVSNKWYIDNVGYGGTRIGKHFLKREVGIGSRSHCLSGEELISRVISSTVSGVKYEKVAEADGGSGVCGYDAVGGTADWSRIILSENNDGNDWASAAWSADELDRTESRRV